MRTRTSFAGWYAWSSSNECLGSLFLTGGALYREHSSHCGHSPHWGQSSRNIQRGGSNSKCHILSTFGQQIYRGWCKRRMFVGILLLLSPCRLLVVDAGIQVFLTDNRIRPWAGRCAPKWTMASKRPSILAISYQKTSSFESEKWTSQWLAPEYSTHRGCSWRPWQVKGPPALSQQPVRVSQQL